MPNPWNVNDEVIYRDHVHLILVTNLNESKPKMTIIDEDQLKWNDEDSIAPHLSLQEISDQLVACGYTGVFYVWTEIGVRGRIYQYGNYKPYDFWVEHGRTKGYA